MTPEQKNQMENLGIELYRIRLWRGMTLRQVADKTGFSTTYIQELEHGKYYTPSPRFLFRISEVLGCSYVKLMKLAGYASLKGASHESARTPTLSHALGEEQLTQHEADELMKYLTWVRFRDA